MGITGTIEAISKAAGDRTQVFGMIRGLARETFVDLPEAQAIEKVMDRWPELRDAYYRAPLPRKAAVAKVEDLPGHEIVEAIVKLEADTSPVGARDRGIEIALLKGRYYRAIGLPVAAARFEEQAEKLAKYR